MRTLIHLNKYDILGEAMCVLFSLFPKFIVPDLQVRADLCIFAYKVRADLCGFSLKVRPNLCYYEEECVQETR